MSGDHGVIKAVYKALSEEMADQIPMFHYVPHGVMPPYGVMELVRLGQGNGLPSPHFQARGEMAVRVWSAYEGTSELMPLLAKVAGFFNGRKLELDPGAAWFEGKDTQIFGQQGSAKNAWREGRVDLTFVVKK